MPTCIVESEAIKSAKEWVQDLVEIFLDLVLTMLQFTKFRCFGYYVKSIMQFIGQTNKRQEIWVKYKSA